MSGFDACKEASISDGICLLGFRQVIKFSTCECFAFHALSVRQNANTTTNSCCCCLHHSNSKLLSFTNTTCYNNDFMCILVHW